MSTYFTRIAINPQRRASRELLGSPHKIHGAVGACFPPTHRPSRPLWRVDRTGEGTFLYLLSDVAPDATHVVENYGWPLAGGWETRDYAVVLDAVREGRRFGFRLAANPVHTVRLPPRVTQGESERKRRLAHVTAAQQLEWFLKRAEGWGIWVGKEADEETGEESTRTFEIVERAVQAFPRGGRTVTIGTAVFEGVLTVTDAVRLRRKLVEGFGHAKAYGCGLMTLAPLG